MLEHLFINHNKLGSVLSDMSHKKVSLMPSFLVDHKSMQHKRKTELCSMAAQTEIFTGTVKNSFPLLIIQDS